MMAGVIRQSAAQLAQSVNRDLRGACGHRRAYRRVAHPRGNPPRYVGTNLKMDNLFCTSSQPLDNTQALSMQWMPTIVNDNKLRSVCRMTCDPHACRGTRTTRR
jgi:hypothetical protein